jgi:hypothetical protein
VALFAVIVFSGKNRRFANDITKGVERTFMDSYIFYLAGLGAWHTSDWRARKLFQLISS